MHERFVFNISVFYDLFIFIMLCFCMKHLRDQVDYGGFHSRARHLMWVEFVVGSVPAPRVFLRVLRFKFSSLHKKKKQHFQLLIWSRRRTFDDVK